MGGVQNELKGPDLGQGVGLASVPDGGSLLGHAGGEAVLIARHGDEVFAVGATCTHYSGPLAEGVVVFEGGKAEVRCPWHHACFSLRTGEAMRAPALAPIACYRVERQGGLVRVGKAKAAPEQKTAPSMPRRVVIV